MRRLVMSSVMAMLCCYGLCTVPAAACSIKVQAPVREVEQSGGRLLVMPGYSLATVTGLPMLPVRPVFVSVPAGTDSYTVELTAIRGRLLPGAYDIPPAPAPTLFSMSGAIGQTNPDPAVYGRDAWFPSLPMDAAGVVTVRGEKYALLRFHPLRYNPACGSVYAVEELEYRLVLTPAGTITSGAETPLAALLNDAGGSRSLAAGEVQYLIVTTEEYAPVFRELRDWKHAKGVPAALLTMEEIEAAYSGVDAAGKLRNCLREYFMHKGLRWVLLGGDMGVVPLRWAFAMDCEYGSREDENDLVADLYYSDLDGSWDVDGDGIFGEVADHVDLMPELYVGRAPVDTMTEAEAFVAKTLQYETAPPADHWNQALFLGDVLWDDPYTDSGVCKDMIDDESFSDAYEIIKLYMSMGNETPEAAIAAINAGMNIINHNGHAMYSGVGTGTGSLIVADMDALVNGDRQGIFYSIGCWSAALDYDGVSEHFVTNPNGGGIAYIGNSRYGWGSPGYPGYGVSDQFDRCFFHYLLAEGRVHLGEALALTKVSFIDRSREENVFRWHQYQLNLLGDPEVAVWTAAPLVPVVAAPASLPAGVVDVTVVVTDDGGAAVEGATVCFSNDDGVYGYEETDRAGAASVPLEVSGATVRLVVSGANLVPHSSQVPVVHQGPWLHAVEARVDDGAGNGDGEINPGETFDLTVVLENLGGAVAHSPAAVLSCDAAGVTVVSGATSYGDIAAGSHGQPAASFQLAVAAGTAATGFQCLLTLSFDGDETVEVLPLCVRVPRLEVAGYVVYDNGGDGDGVADPGERVDLYVLLRNEGGGWAHDIDAVLSSSPEYTVAAAGCIYPDLPAGEGSGGVTPFTLVIDGSLADGAVVESLLEVTHDGGREDLPVTLTIGATGFRSGMETGEGWTVEGGGWCRTTYRPRAGSYSYYCGDEESRRYSDNMDCALVSPPIQVAPESMLSYWRWYKVPMFGNDGMVVEIEDGDEWVRLHYEGSGGALPVLYLRSEWTKVNLDISGYPGERRIRFRFISNANMTEEGFYVDDVEVAGYTGNFHGAEEPTCAVMKPLACAAGWWDTALAAGSGEITFAAWVLDPGGRGIRRVSLLADGMLTGIDLAAMPGSDMLFILDPVPVSGLAPATLLLQVAAQNDLGVWSDPWPELKVD
ncbi:hypothetical protein JW905_11915 [bacterium]|nr:hypothetical protein [candidate division CSSED10-310 bacterium]